MIHLPLSAPELNALLVLLGLCVGVLGCFFGVGGGWMMTPTLNILGFSMPIAIGTGIAYITGMSVTAVFHRRKLGNVDLRLGITVATAMVVGVELGKRTVGFLENRGMADIGIRWTYLFLLTVVAGFMYWDYLGHRRRNTPDGGPERRMPK